jgi:putative ABC transport system permease protein
MRRWWGSLRVATRIARRDALRAKSRTALVAVLVGLPVLAGSAVAVIAQSSEPGNATYVRWHLGDEAQALISAPCGSAVTQDPRGESYECGGASSGVQLADYEDKLRAALPAGDALVPILEGAVGLSTNERRLQALSPTVEMPRAAGLAGIAALAAGAFPTGPSQVALSRSYADQLAIGIGDSVTLTLVAGAPHAVVDEPVTAVVTGILAPDAAGEGVVVAPGTLFHTTDATAPTNFFDVTAKWYVTGPTPVTWHDVLALNAVGSSVTSRAVILNPPARSEVPYWAKQGPPSGPSSETLALWGAVAAIGLLETVLLIGPAFAVGARRSERQLALLAAAGAERRTLRQVVLQTGLVIGAAAAVLGAGLGIAIAAGIRAVLIARGSLFTPPDLRVPVPTILGLVALGPLVGVTAAFLPAHRAARVDVVAVLSGRRAETRLRSGVPIVGLALFAVGAMAAFVGAKTSRPILLVGGVLAVDLGVMAASGALLSAVGLLAPRLGVASRLALRDAARQRGRSAPTVAAVIAAIAGMVAGVMYLESTDAHGRLQWPYQSADGVVAVAFPYVSPTATISEEVPQASESALRDKLPVTEVVPVSIAGPAQGRVPDPTGFTIAVETAPGQICPLSIKADPGEAEVRAQAHDPRCIYEQSLGKGYTVWFSRYGEAVFVDDGSMVAALGFPDSQRAVDALRAGKAVVNSGFLLWPDGTTHVQMGYLPREGADPTDLGTSAVPAVAVPQLGAKYRLILPPSALPKLGLSARPAGLVAPTSRLATAAEEDAARAALDRESTLYIERGAQGDPNAFVLMLIAAALLVGVAATGIAVALAAAESRADLATLSAVGASPRMRRRFAAAQAGVITVIGVGMGIGAGLVFGRVLVMALEAQALYDGYAWRAVTPWSALGAIGIGLPLLTMLGAFLLTRSRLPMVRRIAA